MRVLLVLLVICFFEPASSKDYLAAMRARQQAFAVQMSAKKASSAVPRAGHTSGSVTRFVF